MFRNTVVQRLVIILLALSICFGMPSIYFADPVQALDVSKYPPLDTKSYPPFNQVCTNAEIKELVRSSNPDRIELVFRSLATCGSKTVPALVYLLKTGDTSIRSEALAILAAIGPKAKDAIPALTCRDPKGQATGSTSAT